MRGLIRPYLKFIRKQYNTLVLLSEELFDVVGCLSALPNHSTLNNTLKLPLINYLTFIVIVFTSKHLSRERVLHTKDSIA